MNFKAGLYDNDGIGITGSTDLNIIVKRDIDNYFYDFGDDLFKVGEWISLSAQLHEPSSDIVPGEYEVSVDISGWDNGVYTAYIQYSNSPGWTERVEFRVCEGKQSTALVEELGTQARLDVNAEAGTALSDYDPPTRTHLTTDKDEIIAAIDTNKTRIDTILADTDELQGLISDSRIAAQVKGMDSDVLAADALNTDAVNEIRDVIMMGSVDGAVDVEECLKILLAVLGGDITKDGNTYYYKDQLGATKLTVMVDETGVQRSISQ